MNAVAHKNLKKKNSVKTTYKDFRNFIIDEDHPCIMAQTVFSMDKA